MLLARARWGGRCNPLKSVWRSLQGMGLTRQDLEEETMEISVHTGGGKHYFSVVKPLAATSLFLEYRVMLSLQTSLFFALCRCMDLFPSILYKPPPPPSIRLQCQFREMMGKNEALRDVGAAVPESFEVVIKETSKSLLRKGRLIQVLVLAMSPPFYGSNVAFPAIAPNSLRSSITLACLLKVIQLSHFPVDHLACRLARGHLYILS